MGKISGFVVNEVNYEYNDENYTPSEGGVPKAIFETKEEAIAEAIKLARASTEFLVEGVLLNGDYNAINVKTHLINYLRSIDYKYDNLKDAINDLGLPIDYNDGDLFFDYDKTQDAMKNKIHTDLFNFIVEKNAYLLYEVIEVK